MEEKKHTLYKFMLTVDEAGKYAIKIMIRGVEYIVKPYQIFNSIYCKKGYFLLCLNEEDYCNNKATLRVDTEINGDGVNWIISTVEGPLDRLPAFDVLNYINNIEDVLDGLLTVINDGKLVLYNDNRNFYYKYNLHSEVNGMCQQIKNTK